ncbi:MAG: NAD(P)H-hydrate epimerase [Planctomycetes bacterium]|nr:NAD(P)H-hydrate epimerase [Planctomycetota bacterium]MCB9912896.1 NAD(P)H-hydrate epimerase [Planctomycetota bacterium]HPF13645.1 NAD(P)H-hydrate epimerase [Planctomycetota bacterium]
MSLPEDSPYLTRAQVREVDRLAIEDLGIPGIVLMENASLGVVRHAQAMLTGPDRSVAIVCGAGNNGGDGFAVARHLHNAGARVQLFVAQRPAALRGDAGIMARICATMGLPLRWLDGTRGAGELAAEWGAYDLVIDALLGTGFEGSLRAPMGTWIEALALVAEQASAPILAVDIPSGLDADSGEALGPTVLATRTVTFVAPKRGFANPAAASFVGEVFVEGIGAPASLIDRVGDAR